MLAGRAYHATGLDPALFPVVVIGAITLWALATVAARSLWR